MSIGIQSLTNVLLVVGSWSGINLFAYYLLIPVGSMSGGTFVERGLDIMLR
jgi:hypothetical protein